MFKSIPIAFLVVSNFIFLAMAQADPDPKGQLSIRVQLKDLGSEVSYQGKTEIVLSQSLMNGLAKGKKSLEDFVEITLPGALYDPPLEFKPVARSEAKWDSPVQAALADFSAFKSKNDKWILENFLPGEQKEIKKNLDNKKMMEAMFKTNEATESRQITGELRYKDYAMVFVKDVPSLPGSEKFGPLPYAFKKAPEGWKRTNALSSDEIMDVLFGVLHNQKGEMKAIRAESK